MAAELQVIESSTQISRPATFAPQTFSEALTFAEYLSKSSFVPQEFRGKPENILVAIQHGAELGLPPMQSLNCICVINGKPAIYGPSALAVVKAHRDFEYIKEWYEKETLTAHCEVKRRGEPVVTRSFSKEDAVRAGLWDDRKMIKKKDSNYEFANPSPWHCYPERMQMFRARGFALNDCMPDALRGIVTAEEARDYPGETVEGERPTTSTAAPATAKPAEEPTIGMPGGNEFFKIYANNGWTSEQSLEFLATIGITKPKSSKDIPVSEWTSVPSSEWTKGGEIPGGRAWKWATSPSPIKAEVTRKFDLLDFTPDERRDFFKANAGEKKAEMYVNVDKALSAELDKRAEAEQ